MQKLTHGYFALSEHIIAMRSSASPQQFMPLLYTDAVSGKRENLSIR